MAIEKERLVGEKSVEKQKEPLMTDLDQRESYKVRGSAEAWIREMEKAPKVGQVGTGAKRGGGLKSTTPASPKIKLPATRKTFVVGFSKTVSDAGKWFSTFLFRLIKIKKGEVEFKNDE